MIRPVAEKAVHRVELVEGGLGLIAVIAEKCPDHRPVLLLGVRLVVLPVRARAGEGELLAVAVPDEMGIEKLTAVIGIDPSNGKGRRSRMVVSAPKTAA